MYNEITSDSKVRHYTKGLQTAKKNITYNTAYRQTLKSCVCKTKDMKHILIKIKKYYKCLILFLKNF